MAESYASKPLYYYKNQFTFNNDNATGNIHCFIINNILFVDVTDCVIKKNLTNGNVICEGLPVNYYVQVMLTKRNMNNVPEIHRCKVQGDGKLYVYYDSIPAAAEQYYGNGFAFN